MKRHLAGAALHLYQVMRRDMYRISSIAGKEAFVAPEVSEFEFVDSQATYAPSSKESGDFVALGEDVVNDSEV